MVEFGLKLDDNKVQEWSDKYMKYEELKKLIKNAKKAADARKELEKRNPSLAAEIKAKSTRGPPRLIGKSASGVLLSSSNGEMSKDALTVSGHSLAASLGENERTPDAMSGHSLASLGEICPGGDGGQGEVEMLLPKEGDAGSVTKYGSNESKKRGRMNRAMSESSIGSYLSSKVKEILKISPYEQNLIDAIDTETLAKQKFTIELYQNVALVNSFYNGLVNDIESRLDLLKENATPGYQFHSKKSQAFTHIKASVKKIGTNLIRRQDNADGTDYISDDDLELDELTASQREEVEATVKEADSIKRALTDLHRRSKLLVNFAIINSTAFVKIIKKFTKNFPDMKGEFKELAASGYCCAEGKRIVALSESMEVYYAACFCDGNATEARSHMLPKKGDGLDMDWSQLRLGYRLGMCSILAIWVMWDCVWGLVREGHSTIGGRTAFPVFRACGGLLLIHWFWGLSVYVWNRYRVNYIFLFDFDPRIVDTPIMILEDATDETLIFLSLMLLYYKSGAGDIPDIIRPGGYPFILVLYTIKCIVFPLKTRVPMWKAIGAVVTAPLSAPTFFQTYVADVFTSMVKVFQDILWTGCFVVSGDFLIKERNDININALDWHESFWYKNIVIPLICLFPLWIRFNQCLRRYADTGKRMPHLANAFKYALSQTVTLFGAFHPLYLMHEKKVRVSDNLLVEVINDSRSLRIFSIFWFGIFITSSLYSFFWDVYMDWGLGRPKYGWLGSRLMYPKRSSYYSVMAIDLFLRFMWVTTLIPPQSGAAFEIPSYLTMITMAMELFRRTLWGFFRLEHEHRHNTSGFRRVDFVPLHFTTEHAHKYKQKEHVGWSVLGEVTIITCIVLTISAASVISAQKATNGMALASATGDTDDL